MEKIIIILSMLTFVSCGQENIASTITELEESFGEVRIVIVDEEVTDSQETPYYHEVTDDQSDNENSTVDDSNQDIEGTSEDKETDNSSEENTTNPEEDTTQTIQIYEKRTATIYKTKDGDFKIINDSNQELPYLSISKEAKTKIDSWIFPNDSFTSEITYSLLSKFENYQASILERNGLGHIVDIKTIDKSTNIERQPPTDYTMYCGLIYIDQTPIEQGTTPIYVANIEDGKNYRVHNSGLINNIGTFSNSIITHYEILQELESIVNKSTNGCIFTDDDYYFNYELPEYRRIINIEGYNIGW